MQIANLITMHILNRKKFLIAFLLSFTVIIAGGTYVLSIPSAITTIYLVRGVDGSLHVKRDLKITDSDKLLFMVDLSGVFSHVDRSTAFARNKPVLELSWDENEGEGTVKDFRPDGTAISVAFSRNTELDGSSPKGLFVGGDLPFADSFRSARMNTSGVGYYDGKDWYHIWCTGNEGFSLSGSNNTVNPTMWEYKGTKVLKQSEDEIIIESHHLKTIDGIPVAMTRRATFGAGRDYFVLNVMFTNNGGKPISFGYSYGDEPWIGSFGGSRGDVGWYEGGLVKTEAAISPQKYRYAGYWDFGNELAGEKHDYTGYANFIEWNAASTPSYVYFSNSFEHCCGQSKPLDSEDNRVIELLWLNQPLQPGASRNYTLAIGMARLDAVRGSPKVPDNIF